MASRHPRQPSFELISMILHLCTGPKAGKPAKFTPHRRDFTEFTRNLT
jgi:hypothetical protein